MSSLCQEVRVVQPTMSHHLGLLRQGGLVRTRRDGKFIHYAVSEHVRPDELLATSHFAVRIDRLIAAAPGPVPRGGVAPALPVPSATIPPSRSSPGPEVVRDCRASRGPA